MSMIFKLIYLQYFAENRQLCSRLYNLCVLMKYSLYAVVATFYYFVVGMLRERNHDIT